MKTFLLKRPYPRTWKIRTYLYSKMTIPKDRAGHLNGNPTISRSSFLLFSEVGRKLANGPMEEGKKDHMITSY